MQLTTPLATVLRTTPDHLAALAQMNLRTVGDLLLYLPRAHEDLSDVRTIALCPLDEKVSLRGSIENLKIVRIRGGKFIVEGSFLDTEGGRAKVVWFNQPHIMRMLKAGDPVVLTGKLTEKGSRIVLQSPQFERAGDAPLVHAGRIVPIYPQHDRITTKWLREKMVLMQDAIALLPETLPADVLAHENLMGRADAIRALHFPQKPEDTERARQRIAFEQVFLLQREALVRRADWQRAVQARLRTPMDVALVRAFFASLKFRPTDSQKIAIYEILRDLERDVPMSRLLEGDVGSGKTLVAVAVMAVVTKAAGQSALMVPTEILAAQHAQAITRMLLGIMQHFPSPPRVVLLTGSTPPVEADRIRAAAAAGTADVLIGTHALIEDAVRFKDLRIAIVDEQHRFGVLQRERLKEKGSPHFLSMTATPIPRTLALTAYGDHDLSVLLEKPGNRKPIRTRVVPPHDRRTIELFIDREIAAGCQVFVICPLIEESDAEGVQEVKNVEAEIRRLRDNFPRRRIGKLHGRMTPREKGEMMRLFKERAYDILVTTAVVEVGVDVPNASIIVIEGAERFGLAQLHQFRGRTGRGEHQSYCFLFTTAPEQAQSPRLKAMEQYESGFELAEVDLRLRGPGEIFGTRQSGILDVPFASLLNPALIVRARRAAEKTLGIGNRE